MHQYIYIFFKRTNLKFHSKYWQFNSVTNIYTQHLYEVTIYFYLYDTKVTSKSNFVNHKLLFWFQMKQKCIKKHVKFVFIKSLHYILCYKHFKFKRWHFSTVLHQRYHQMLTCFCCCKNHDR